MIEVIKPTRKNIWNFRQNKPSQVVSDIMQRYPDIDENFLYEVLLKRGILKWLSVRRDLIRLKHDMKGELRDLNKKKTPKEKGYYEAVNKYRGKIRKLCHSPRWQAPGFDRKANNFLMKRR